MLSQAEDPEAYDLISKCKFIDDNLPGWMRSKRDPDQRGSIGFPDSSGEIRALPSTERAGRSTDATIVVCDEWEYHPYAEINYGALRPTISAGGQFIGLSTADPMKTAEVSFFKQRYTKAKIGDSDFFKVFLPWYIRPGRDQAWYDRETRDMPSWQKQGEYPSSEDDLLSTLKTRKFFSPEALILLKAECRAHIKHDMSDRYPSVKIYKLPVIGKHYLIANDPSEGREDPHAIIVVDRYGEQVAESHGYTTADQCASIHDMLVRLYNSAFNTWETGPGGAAGIVTNKLEELKTPNRCASIIVSKRPFELDIKSGKKGWWTSKALKDVAWEKLEESVRLFQIMPRNADCIEEFSSIVVPEGEDVRKPRGGHDDYIDAWARICVLMGFAPMDKIPAITSGFYKG